MAEINLQIHQIFLLLLLLYYLQTGFCRACLPIWNGLSLRLLIKSLRIISINANIKLEKRNCRRPICTINNSNMKYPLNERIESKKITFYTFNSFASLCNHINVCIHISVGPFHLKCNSFLFSISIQQWKCVMCYY